LSFTAASPVVIGTGTVFTTIRSGDYVKRDAHAETAWTRVLRVESDTRLILDGGYLGATVAGASSKCNYVLRETANLAIANSVFAIAQPVTANAVSGILRAVDYPPLYYQGYGLIDARRDHQATYIGFVDSTSVVNAACFVLDGVLATTVKCRTCTSAAAVDTLDTTIVLPGGALTSANHLYEVRQYADKVMFYFDGTLIATHTRHLPYMYAPMMLGVFCVNDGVGTGGVTTISIDDHRVENMDRFDAVTSQPRAEKLRAQTQDITPNCAGLSVSTAVAGNVAVVITTAVDVGKRYRVTVVGGEGLAIRHDGVAPTVAMEPVWDKDKIEFVATVSANAVGAIKRVAGTADATVIVTALDGGAVS
jgi:hypothetical protein